MKSLFLEICYDLQFSKLKRSFLNEPQCQNMYLWAYAHSEDSDQPAHSLLHCAHLGTAKDAVSTCEQ